MKTFYKTTLMAAVVALMATGAHAEGYEGQDPAGSPGYNTMQNDGRMESQGYNGIPGDGSMNPEGNSTMMNDNGMDSQNSNDMQQYQRMSSADIRAVQESLNDNGYNVAVDGVWGTNTTDAIRSFQQNNDLDATGNLDAQTRAQLDVETNSDNDGM